MAPPNGDSWSTSIRRAFFLSSLGVCDGGRGGASICSSAYLHGLSTLFRGSLTLICPRAEGGLRGVPEGVCDVIEVPERSSFQKARHLLAGVCVDRLSPFVDRAWRNQDFAGSLVFINSSRGGRFAKLVKQGGGRCVTLFHNVEERFHAAGDRNPFMRFLNARAADRNDRTAYRFSDASIFLSPHDAELMRARQQRMAACAATITDGYFSPPEDPCAAGVPETTHRTNVLVACSLGIAQNLEGIRRFVSHAWVPCLGLPELAGARLVLAGGMPAPDIRRLAAEVPRIDLIANPTDAEMRRAFGQARVCVSTIEVGSGIKIRVAEGLKHGCPVVATPHSAIGYESVDPRVVRSAPIERMHLAIRDIFASGAGERLDLLARREFEARFSYAAGVERLRRVIASVAAGGQLP